MERRNEGDRQEPEIVYSRSVKAGKRVYYLDVKKARNEDLYLCITESKKKSEMGEQPMFEKHRLFLYKEDFAHFTEGLQDVINYVQAQVGEIEERKPFILEEEEKNVETEFSELVDNEAETEKPERRRLFARFRKE